MSEIDDLKAENKRLAISAELYLRLYKACSLNQGISRSAADLQARLWTLQEIIKIRTSRTAKILEAATADAVTKRHVAGLFVAWTEIQRLLEKAIYSDDDLMQNAELDLPS